MIGPFQAKTPLKPLLPTIPQEAAVGQLTPQNPQCAFVQYVVAEGLALVVSTANPRVSLLRRPTTVQLLVPEAREMPWAFPDCGIRTRTGPTVPLADTGAMAGTLTIPGPDGMKATAVAQHCLEVGQEMRPVA